MANDRWNKKAVVPSRGAFKKKKKPGIAPDPLREALLARRFKKAAVHGRGC